MNKPEFVYVSFIATTPEKLWAALTDGKFTKAYWYNRRIQSDWVVGAPVHFYDGDSDTITDSGIVLSANPPTLLSYSFHYEQSAAEALTHYSRVTFTIEPHPNVVKLTLVHDELYDESSIAGWREGWAPILSSLKTYLETGAPLPQVEHIEKTALAAQEAAKQS